MAIGIGANNPCGCPPDRCMHFVEPPAACVNRLDGEVVTGHCPQCYPNSTAETWHHNGRCLRCAAIMREQAADNQPDRSGVECE